MEKAESRADDEPVQPSVRYRGPPIEEWLFSQMVLAVVRTGHGTRQYRAEGASGPLLLNCRSYTNF